MNEKIIEEVMKDWKTVYGNTIIKSNDVLKVFPDTCRKLMKKAIQKTREEVIKDIEEMKLGIPKFKGKDLRIEHRYYNQALEQLKQKLK